MKRFLSPIIIMLILLLLLNGCNRHESPVEANAEAPQIRIGCKTHTEQLILMKILSIYLKEQGYPVSEFFYMPSPVARAALENDQIDLYWEYTGTALRLFYQRPTEADPERAYQTIRQLDREKGLVWLEMAKANSTYSILMRRDKAEQLGISSLSQLAAYLNRQSSQFLFASSPEFNERVDGLQGLQQRYGFRFLPDKVQKMETKLLYNALREDQFDVIAGIATDGRITRYDLLELEDDLDYFPAYNGAPVARQQLLEQYPELTVLINKIPGLISNETLKEMTYQVDVERKDVFEVVRAWLAAQQLLEDG